MHRFFFSKRTTVFVLLVPLMCLLICVSVEVNLAYWYSDWPTEEDLSYLRHSQYFDRLQNLTSRLRAVKSDKEVDIKQVLVSQPRNQQDNYAPNYNPNLLFMPIHTKTSKNITLILKQWTCANLHAIETSIHCSTDEQSEGKLPSNDGTTVDVTCGSIMDHGRGDKTLLRKDVKVFFNLYLMQSWPGVPKLHAVCIVLKNEQEVESENHFSVNDVKAVRYIIQRYTKAQPFCGPLSGTDPNSEKCLNLFGLMNHLKFSPFSLIGSIKTMISVSKMFETFLISGVYPLNFHPKDLVFTDAYDVVMRFPDAFQEFLFSDVHNGGYMRFLSGTTCTSWLYCPRVGLDNRGAFLYKLGKHCKELRGYCTSKMQCSGIDAHLHLCIFSKWIFQMLSDQIPDNWPHKFRLNELLLCSGQPTPQYRCSWTSFLRGLNIVLQYAQEKF